MTFKEKVFAQCRTLLEEKISSLQTILIELEKGAENDNKSSAGDKHETSRAMMQIEQEKIGRQLKEVLEQKIQFEKLGFPQSATEIKKGSLVKTNKGYLFFSVPLGKILVDETSVMSLSPQSPIALKLFGIKEGSSVEFNGVSYLIEKVE